MGFFASLELIYLECKISNLKSVTAQASGSMDELFGPLGKSWDSTEFIDR